MSMTIEPRSSGIGAFIRGTPDEVLTGDAPMRVLDTLNRHSVVIFPEIHMSDDQFLALTDALGDRHDAAVTLDKSEASEKGIYRIALDKDDKTQLDYVKGNDYWHMDGTVYDAPGKATLLKCESAPSEGGDTEFASLFAAYDAMPAERKRQLEGMRVVHCLAAVGRRMYDHPTDEDFARWNVIFPPTEHPLVWHQKDGRTSLLIGSTADSIVGLGAEAGTALLDELLDWCTADPFTYRHHWAEGDIVIFNNPGLLHRSRPYTETAARVMHRTTLKGHEAIA